MICGTSVDILWNRNKVKVFFTTVNSLWLCLCQPHANTWPQPYFRFSTGLPLPLWRDVMGGICLAPAPCSTWVWRRRKAKSFVICVEQEAQQESRDLKTDTLWVSPCVIYKVLFRSVFAMVFFLSDTKSKWNVSQITISHCFRLFASSYLLFSDHKGYKLILWYESGEFDEILLIVWHLGTENFIDSFVSTFLLAFFFFLKPDSKLTVVDYKYRFILFCPVFFCSSEHLSPALITGMVSETWFLVSEWTSSYPPA